MEHCLLCCARCIPHAALHSTCAGPLFYFHTHGQVCATTCCMSWATFSSAHSHDQVCASCQGLLVRVRLQDVSNHNALPKLRLLFRTPGDRGERWRAGAVTVKRQGAAL